MTAHLSHITTPRFSVPNEISHFEQSCGKRDISTHIGYEIRYQTRDAMFLIIILFSLYI